jgi:hypothetical protein
MIISLFSHSLVILSPVLTERENRFLLIQGVQAAFSKAYLESILFQTPCLPLKGYIGRLIYQGSSALAKDI